MAILIRTLFNNEEWQGSCHHPYADPKCFLCQNMKTNLGISPPKPGDKVCSGNCWERNVCNEFRWGCTPQGRIFGDRAYPGMKAFLVYKQPDGRYTIWGRTTVDSVDRSITKSDRSDEDGFSFIHFRPFKPLPVDRRVPNMRDRDLVGESFRQGRYRFIDASRETYLDSLIDQSGAGVTGVSATMPIPSSASVEKPVASTSEIAHKETFKVDLMSNVVEKIQGFAQREGRSPDEIVREAVAEWLRQREI